METTWLTVIEWIQLVVALLFLVFVIVVMGVVVRYYNYEFNRFWKSRLAYVGASFVWVVSQLLGRDQLWNPDTGLIPVTSEGAYKTLCQIYILFTFGITQPLFFLIILMMIRSKTKASKDLELYTHNPNGWVMRWAVLCSMPVVAVHLIIVGLNNVESIGEPYPLFWTTYDSQYHKCVVPMISTGCFTGFYTIFLVFYIFFSNRFSNTLVNRKLQERVRWSQWSFALFFPFEVLFRIVLIFISGYKIAAEILSHAFFFIDLVICIVGVLEFALMPILDACEYPLLSGITKIYYQNISTIQTGVNYEKQNKNPRSEVILLDNVLLEAKPPDKEIIIFDNNTV